MPFNHLEGRCILTLPKHLQVYYVIITLYLPTDKTSTMCLWLYGHLHLLTQLIIYRYYARLYSCGNYNEGLKECYANSALSSPMLWQRKCSLKVLMIIANVYILKLIKSLGITDTLNHLQCFGFYHNYDKSRNVVNDFEWDYKQNCKFLLQKCNPK